MKLNRKILLISYNFPPALNVGAKRPFRFAKELADLEYQVTVLSSDSIDSHDGNQLLQTLPPSVTVHRVEDASQRSTTEPLPIRRNLSKRLINTIAKTFSASLTRSVDKYEGWAKKAIRLGTEICQDNDIDIVLSTGPPHSTHFAAKEISRITGKPFIADFRDPCSRTPWKRRENILRKAAKASLERSIVSNAAAVILTNDAAKTDFEKAYANQHAEKFITIHNAYDINTQRMVDQALNDAPTPQDRDAIPLICHAGTLYGERSPEALLRTLQKLNKSGNPITFHQIGKCASHCNPLNFANRFGISHLVQHTSFLSQEKLFQSMWSASALVILQPNGDTMVPAKLYEMLLFDKPIIFLGQSVATENILREAGGAFIFSSASESLDEFKRATNYKLSAKDLEQRTVAKLKFASRNSTHKLGKLCDSILSS